MRIAYVVNSLEGGGAALPLPAVLDVLRSGGASVDLYALAERDGRAAPPLRAAGFPPRTAPPGVGRIGAVRWLHGELRTRRPDLIWTSLTHATVAGQLAGAALRVPVVSWQHNAFLKPANLRLLRATASLTGLWVADSAAVADLTAARLRTPRDRLRVWPLFRAGGVAPAGAPAAGEVWRVGSLGRLHSNKGYDVLVDALARLASDAPAVLAGLRVEVAGEGTERPALEAAAARAAAPCRFDGFAADPAAFLRGLQAYVQPSRAEGLCIAAHEAMEAGLPVVVSDVGEMARTVREAGAGWVVPPGDAAALADALICLRADPAEAAVRGARGRAWVRERFSAAAFDRAGREALAAAEALVSARRGGRS